MYRDERKVMKIAPAVLHNEHNRITDPLVLITLSILICKEETNNITLCLKNFRNIDSLLQIIRKKIVDLSSYMLYWENRLITYSNMAIKSFDKIQYYIDFIILIRSERSIRIGNTCKRAFDGGSKFFLLN
ncbi:MAG TPA: hypothetical protein VEW92_13860 [Nitrososphaeraceae archaeon]|nr:hypothetical protein [Nitrososphaeraceae archaeon]